MLVLTRYTGQKIKIGLDIEIVVSSVSGKQVSIGIDAPQDIPVHQDETHPRNKEGQPRQKRD